MKTLIPVDGSVYTTRLLDFVCKHRPLLGEPPEITLVTVVPSVPSHAANYLGHDVLTGYYQEQADAVLHPALATLRAAGIEATPLFRKGHAAEVIGKMADAEGFELLLMGSHGHSALRGLVLGSVVAGVLARCQVPLLVVR